jgi:hypothetical protein
MPKLSSAFRGTLGFPATQLKKTLHYSITSTCVAHYHRQFQNPDLAGIVITDCMELVQSRHDVTVGFCKNLSTDYKDGVRAQRGQHVSLLEILRRETRHAQIEGRST